MKFNAYLKWESVTFNYQLSWLHGVQMIQGVLLKTLGLLYRPGSLQWVFSLYQLFLPHLCDFSYGPCSILLQQFQCAERMWLCHVSTSNVLPSTLFFPVRCFIITNSNKGSFYYLRYSVAFVLQASAVTSEDCIQGAKCAGPRVRAAEYTNLRKHRQWIANDTHNKTRKKTFTQKTTKELYRHWIGFLYTLILLNCVW